MSRAPHWLPNLLALAQIIFPDLTPYKNFLFLDLFIDLLRLFTFSTNQLATIAPTPFLALPPPPPPPPLHNIIYPFPISLVPFAFQITPANNKYQCEVSSESQQFPQISLRMYQHSRRKARFVPVYQEFFSYQSTGALKSSYGIQCVPSSEGRHWWCLKGTLGVTPPYNILTIINEIKLAKILQ